MKINTIIFFISYFLLVTLIYIFLFNILKDKKRFIKYSFIIYIFYLILLLFFLENIYNTKYLVFNFRSDFFSSQYMMNTSINFRPFFILNFITHKPTFLGYIFNIVCFIPLGIYISYYLNDKKYKVIYVFLFLILISSIIEFLQFLLPINRVSDIDDVVANTLGGIVGYLIYLIYNYNNKSKTT